MRIRIVLSGVTLLLALMAYMPVSAGAQDTTLTTQPLSLQDVTSTLGAASELAGGQAAGARVKVNINNENLREAIKKVIGKADVTYEIDSDVPNDIKVSLKAENILLTTAINVLIESAGIGCTQSNKHTVTETNGVKSNVVQTHYHFRKAPTPPLGHGPASWFLDMPRNLLDKNVWNGTELNTLKMLDKNPDLSKQFGTTLLGPNGANDLSNRILDGLKVYSSTADGVRPMLYNLTSTEERSTFTCPHCKQQVTIIKKHVAVKCPTCGRTFQDDWKFCPVDGAKRPDDPGEWKFCPHCGKAVP